MMRVMCELMACWLCVCGGVVCLYDACYAVCSPSPSLPKSPACSRSLASSFSSSASLRSSSPLPPKRVGPRIECPDTHVVSGKSVCYYCFIIKKKPQIACSHDPKDCFARHDEEWGKSACYKCKRVGHKSIECMRPKFKEVGLDASGSNSSGSDSDDLVRIAYRGSRTGSRVVGAVSAVSGVSALGVEGTSVVPPAASPGVPPPSSGVPSGPFIHPSQVQRVSGRVPNRNADTGLCGCKKPRPWKWCRKCDRNDYRYV